MIWHLYWKWDCTCMNISLRITQIFRWGLYNKLTPIVIDMSRYGDAVARIYTQNKQGTESNNFTVVSPELWFPIVDREVKENRKTICCYSRSKKGKDNTSCTLQTGKKNP